MYKRADKYHRLTTWSVLLHKLHQCQRDRLPTNSINKKIMKKAVIIIAIIMTTTCSSIYAQQSPFKWTFGVSGGIANRQTFNEVLDARKGYVDTFNEYTPANLAHSLVLKPLPPSEVNYALTGRRQARRNEIFDNLRWLDANIDAGTPGMHVLKVYMVDPELVLEQIVVNPDDHYPSYMGAPAIEHH